MVEQQRSGQAYDHYQLMIAERVKNLETKEKMLRRQLNNDIRIFNQTLVRKRNRFLNIIIPFSPKKANQR